MPIRGKLTKETDTKQKHLSLKADSYFLASFFRVVWLTV